MTTPNVSRISYEPYKYTPLPNSSSIRLLELPHGGDPRPNVRICGQYLIQCRLKAVDLDDKPDYEALSYTWGNPFLGEEELDREYEATNR